MASAMKGGEGSAREAPSLEQASLVEVQTFLVQAVQHPTALADHPPLAARAHELATGSARLSPVEQVDVYREQFWLRHVASLEEDFPTLVHLLGRDGFADLARRYLAAHPPTAFSLRDLPDRLPELVAREAPWAEDRLLADCARTEWAFIEAFDAADAPPLDLEKVAALPEEAWASVELVFHPSLRRLALAYPAHDYRVEVREGKAPPRPSPREVHVVVFRAKDDRVRYLEVDPLPFALLELLAAGVPLGTAGERVAESSGQGEMIEANIGAWFQAWTSYGWITDLRVAAT